MLLHWYCIDLYHLTMRDRHLLDTCTQTSSKWEASPERHKSTI
jgi:hypothetical protein